MERRSLMLRFRTIRQRRRRANKAQVAAVATIFGLLLVVTMISNFLTQQLPQLETTAELDHTLQVENQMSRLQATILAEAKSHIPGLSLASPITLGSMAVPPFGGPATGSILPESGRIQTSASYSLSSVIAASPNWNAGSACLNGGSGTCSTPSVTDSWNISNANNTARAVTISGTSNVLNYQLNGNNDTLTVTWSANNLAGAMFIINGSNNAVTFKKSGTDTTTSPTLSFFFYGQSDTFAFNPAGSASSAGGVKVYVQFVGTAHALCPYGSISSSDKVGTLTSGATNLNLTVVWYNTLGMITSPHSQTYPGGSGKNETIHWSNRTGVLSCPFLKTFPTSYQNTYNSGLLVRIYNSYLPITDVAYDQGAVIQSQSGGSPVLVSAPDLEFTALPSGYAATLTLVNVIGNITAEAGLITASVTTHVVQKNILTIINGQGSTYLTTPVTLNFTTSYPAAWLRYIATIPQIFPSGASCVPFAAIAAPYSCASPPPGTVVKISAPLNVIEFTLTSITVTLSVQ